MDNCPGCGCIAGAYHAPLCPALFLADRFIPGDTPDTVKFKPRNLFGLDATAWKQAVVDQCEIAGIEMVPEDPRRTIERLIKWHIEVALDPSVSAAARDLLNRPPRSLYQRFVEWFNYGREIPPYCVHDQFYRSGPNGEETCVGCGRPRLVKGNRRR